MKSLLIYTLCAVALLQLTVSPVFAERSPNTLTAEEQSAGWKLLFDGKTSTGWRGVEMQTFPAEGWKVENGELKVLKGFKKGDIVTTDEFENYELVWEWNLSEGGNSGVKYNLVNPKIPLGCEFQLLDDLKHDDGIRNGPIHHTGSLYDLIPPPPDKKLNPPGQWNECRLIVKGNHVEHWLNGAKIVEYEFGSDALKAKIAKSKYKDNKDFGEKRKSPILLQDHGDAVAFRNIRIRILE